MAKFGGFMGGGNNMQALMRQAQKMQEDMQKNKEEIESTEYKSSVGGGMVTVCMMGNRELKTVEINPAVVDPDDIETLQDLIVAGVNDVLSQIDAEEKAKLPQL